MNKAAMRRLAKHMRGLRHEEHYDQATLMEQTQCGTVACLAGHQARLVGKVRYVEGGPFVWVGPEKPKRNDVGSEKKYMDPIVFAQKTLGLSVNDASKLFAGTAKNWPEGYRVRFEAAVAGVSSERPSRVAADLLDDLADGRTKLPRGWQY